MNIGIRAGILVLLSLILIGYTMASLFNDDNAMSVDVNIEIESLSGNQIVVRIEAVDSGATLTKVLNATGDWLGIDPDPDLERIDPGRTQTFTITADYDYQSGEKLFFHFIEIDAFELTVP